MPGLSTGGASSPASKIFVKMGIAPPIIPPSTQGDSSLHTDDARDDASSFTESEMNFLATNPKKKCELWLNSRSLADPPSNPASPVNSRQTGMSLVPYTPSASSTSTRRSHPGEKRGVRRINFSPSKRSILIQKAIGNVINVKDKRLGYNEPPRQIALISASEKENVFTIGAPQTDSDTSPKLGLDQLTLAPPSSAQLSLISDENTAVTTPAIITRSTSKTDCSVSDALPNCNLDTSCCTQISVQSSVSAGKISAAKTPARKTRAALKTETSASEAAPTLDLATPSSKGSDNCNSERKTKSKASPALNVPELTNPSPVISSETTPTQRRTSKRKASSKVPSKVLSDSSGESLFSEGESEDSFQIDSLSEDSAFESQEAISHSSKVRNLEFAEMEDSDDERHSVPQKKIRKRKKNVKCSREEKARKKNLRNSGQEYTSYSNKVVPARKRRPTHTCKRRKCQDIITDDVGDVIFHEYWEQESYEKRVLYVSSRVEIVPVKTKRPRVSPGDERSHPKSVHHKYFFHIHGEAKQVCKETFLGTLGETDGFLRFAVSKKSKSVSGTVQEDRRGKHTPKHKLKAEVVEEVKTHVLRFPSYKSHYKRSEVGDTRYLPSHLDIRQMYNMYIDKGHSFVSYSSYERIFNTLGRSFKKPSTDTCQKCDSWHQMLKEEKDPHRRVEIEKLRDAHLDRAQAAYDFKKQLKNDGLSDPSLRVLIFDLEQVLETPLLTTGAAFYLRQLSTYNLTIYDSTTKITHCYMWSEVDGSRGANEIASCIYYHCLDVVPDTIKKVVLFSDSTSGQNRNSILAAMFLLLLQMHASIQTVEHVFLEVGHTRMEVDCKHSVIERKKSHCDQINIPSDWYRVVRELGEPNQQYPEGRFRVTEMKGEFYDFQSLLKGPLVLRHHTTQKEKFSWMTTPLLRYEAKHPGKVFFKRVCKIKGTPVLTSNDTEKLENMLLPICHAIGSVPTLCLFPSRRRKRMIYSSYFLSYLPQLMIFTNLSKSMVVMMIFMPVKVIMTIK